MAKVCSQKIKIICSPNISGERKCKYCDRYKTELSVPVDILNSVGLVLR